MKKPVLVTKESLIKMIEANPAHVIGRALVALFNKQTEEERGVNVTKLDNGVGFTQGDARVGCIGAKYFLKHRTLEPWQVKSWMAPNRKGQPRIVKYAGQLNEIAKAKLLRQ